MEDDANDPHVNMAPTRPRLSSLEKLQLKFEKLYGYAVPDGHEIDEEWLKANIAKRMVFRR